MFETKSKTVPITKEMVRIAYRKISANQGSAGVDKKSLEAYHADLLNNLYKLWNRLSSGSYFPQPVRESPVWKQNSAMHPMDIVP
jgi:RNA-directed DNA polymerase